VLTAMRGMVTHAVSAGRAPAYRVPLLYEVADDRDLPAGARVVAGHARLPGLRSLMPAAATARTGAGQAACAIPRSGYTGRT
jgi:hypothetical protein